MQKLTFEMTVEEANLVLEGLGQLPFKQVFALISNLQEQAQEQLNANANGSTQLTSPTVEVEPGQPSLTP